MFLVRRLPTRLLVRVPRIFIEVALLGYPFEVFVLLWLAILIMGSCKVFLAFLGGFFFARKPKIK